MNTKLSLVIGLMVAGFFPALSLYTALQAQAGEYTEEGAIELAVHFLKNNPTYKFDGIPESINVVESYSMRPPAPEWLVSIKFECRHAGYGDRTGKVLAQVITLHTMTVVVVEGRVIKAVIDDKWDELNQQEVVQSELLPPEFAKDLAIEFIRENYPELGTIPTPEIWAFEILTPEGLVGASTQQFTGDGWTVNVSFPIVMKPVYTISIRYSGDVSFEWEGTVDQDRNVDEKDFRRAKISPEPPEFARYKAIDYILQTHEGLGGIQTPSSWKTRDLNTERLPGVSKLQYIGNGWTVNVTNPVVLDPTYTVEIEYNNGISFQWKGTVDQDGNVDEMDFTVVR